MKQLVYDSEGNVSGEIELTEEVASRIIKDIAKQQINQLKTNLYDTDYAIIKIAEGSATVEEYADIIAQRRLWREEINELEAQ